MITTRGAYATYLNVFQRRTETQDAFKDDSIKKPPGSTTTLVGFIMMNAGIFTFCGAGLYVLTSIVINPNFTDTQALDWTKIAVGGGLTAITGQVVFFAGVRRLRRK